MKKYFVLFFMFFSILKIFAEPFIFSNEEEKCISTIIGWDFDYIDIRNGTHFASYMHPEDFNSKNEISYYEVRTCKIDNAQDEKVIQCIFENQRLEKRISISAEKNEECFFYYQDGKISGTNTLKVLYEEDEKILSDTQGAFSSYSIKKCEDGYEIIRKDLLNSTGKTNFRRFIIEDGNLTKVIDGKISASGKIVNGLSYGIDYKNNCVVGMKTYNLNGSVRTEQIINTFKDRVEVDIFQYSSENKITNTKKWIYSVFDEKGNWLEAICISNGVETSKVIRRIEYTK